MPFNRSRNEHNITDISYKIKEVIAISTSVLISFIIVIFVLCQIITREVEIYKETKEDEEIKDEELDEIWSDLTKTTASNVNSKTTNSLEKQDESTETGSLIDDTSESKDTSENI
jgi:hypothetical protein